MYRYLLLAFLLIVANPGHSNSNILILGDSLSAGYGIDQGLGWTDLLQERLQQNGYSHQVINASISGDTTAGGVNRLPPLLEKYQPQLLVIELGGNDGLRGLQLKQTRQNILRMVQLGKASNSEVLLLGMMLPPNFGKAFTDKFLALYGEVAERTESPLVPFFLAGVADRQEWMQPDGIHPNAGGQFTMLENVWPVLESLLKPD